uniref:THAP4-like heme-binding beta-barrel domain-containing protein n=1 Tax=Alexandrium monilatum TaxID=311494 RepID=A0A7S4PZ13_9DINO
MAQATGTAQGLWGRRQATARAMADAKDPPEPAVEEQEEGTFERTVSQEIVQAPKTPPVVVGPGGRAGRRLETAVVHGHTFSVLPSLEGKWSGQAQTLSGKEAATSTKISYQETDGLWQVRTTTADPSGVADVHSLLLEPFAHGRCKVSSDELKPGLYEEQCGDLFATMTHRCVLTGALERMEVWALQTVNATEQRLTRTVTVYKDGDVTSVLVSRERKVA